nr:MAG TPA: hypothetical protein [Bacteriophage sp.]
MHIPRHHLHNLATGSLGLNLLRDQLYFLV